MYKNGHDFTIKRWSKDRFKVTEVDGTGWGYWELRCVLFWKGNVAYWMLSRMVSIFSPKCSSYIVKSPSGSCMFWVMMLNPRRHRGGWCNPPKVFRGQRTYNATYLDETFSTYVSINFTSTLKISWPWPQWPVTCDVILKVMSDENSD